MAECKDIRADQVHGKVDPNIGETSELCEPCKVDDIMQPAAGWCETCDEFLCNDCYKYHCRQKTMRNHQLMSIADMKNMNQMKRLSIKCDKHEGKPLEYFCEDHAELGCSPCLVTKHRSSIRVIYIDDVKTKETKEFKTLETLLSQFEARLKANEENINSNLKRAAREHDKAIADIKEAGDKLKAHIDDLVRQQIIKAQQINENNMRNIGCVDETSKSIAKKVKMIAEDNNDNTRLFVTMKSLQLETEAMNSQLDECKQKNTLREYEFELSSELADVLEKVKYLGTLKDTQVLNMEKATDEVVDVVEVRRCTQYNIHWLEGGDITEAIGVSTDHDIRLLHVLVYACVDDDTDVSLTISEGGNGLIRCNSRYNREAGQRVVAVNPVKERGAEGITLKAGHQYDIGVTRSAGGLGHCYHSGGNGLSNVTEKGVTVTFSNTVTVTFSNTVNVSIAGLRFTII